MKTIIAATDFSPLSTNAVNYAADMACMTDAQLVLFHVYALPMAMGDIPVANYNIEQMEAEAELMIGKLKEKLVERTGNRIIIHTEVRSGDVLTQLLDYCSKIKPYSVVFGAESASGIERALFGGKTLSALKKIQCPLLIVPPLTKFSNIRKIGLACDMKDVVESVRVNEIKELVKEFGAELHVLHVSEETKDTFSQETIEESGMLQEMIGDLHPKYHFINEPVVEKGIIEFAEKNKLDLLIIIPKKHSLVSRLFRYSHSKELVLHAHVPVMSIHE
jgi:nucleotide-binding universal stress UspA family protein